MFQDFWWNWVESKAIDWEKTGRGLGGGRHREPEKCLVEGQWMQSSGELKVKKTQKWWTLFRSPESWPDRALQMNSSLVASLPRHQLWVLKVTSHEECFLSLPPCGFTYITRHSFKTTGVPDSVEQQETVWNMSCSRTMLSERDAVDPKGPFTGQTHSWPIHVLSEVSMHPVPLKVESEL